MVQARGGVKITLREIPFYGIVVVDPSGLLPADAGFEPFLLSINGQSIENQTLSQLRTLLCGQPGTPVTLDLLSEDLNFHQFMTLVRTPVDRIPINEAIGRELEKGFDLLDSVDSGDWPGKYLEQVEKSTNVILEPLSSALFNVSMELSQNWLDRRSFVHLFTQMAAAIYFDKVYKIEDANLSIELALQSLPDFDCLDFDDSSKLFEFADHLIETGRVDQARLLLDKLLSAARNSVDVENKSMMCLLRMIRLPGTESDTIFDEIFELSGLQLPLEDLFLLGDCYLRSGDYKNAIKVYSSSFAQRKLPVLNTIKLRDFIQPRALSKYKQCIAFEEAGVAEGVSKKLKEAVTVFQEFAPEQIALIDQLPAFFPRPKDLAAKIAGLEVATADSAASYAKKPFYLQARLVFETLEKETDLFPDQLITEILSRAANEENALECESLVWAGLLNLARRCLKEERFHLARAFLERISQQSQGADFAPLYLVSCFTEQAIFAEQLGLDSEYHWSRLQALLLNFFAANQLWEREIRDLAAEIPERQMTTLRHETIRAKVLRFWSLVYLRKNDFERAKKILERSLQCAEAAAKIASTQGLQELIGLIHGDLAVAQIELSHLEDAHRSIERMFDEPNSFFTKIYQIAEAYKKTRHIDKAEELLTRSIKLPERRSVLCRRSNFSEHAAHVWKLATLKKEHQQFLEEASLLFPPHSLPPLLAHLAGEYAVSQNQFDIAERHFHKATEFPDWKQSNVEKTYFKRTALLKALAAVEHNVNSWTSHECELIIELAELSQPTNRLSAIINYRRAIALLPEQSRQRNTLLERVRKLTVGKTQTEQFEEEKELAGSAGRDCQVRTERFWIEIATDEFRKNRLTPTIECVTHAMEIYRLSAKAGSNFQPLFVSQRNSLPELLRDKGFGEDAESYLLEAVSITTAKYGVGSEQEALCLAELAHFYFNSSEFEKTMLVAREIVNSYIALLILSGTRQESKSTALIFRMHQLTLQMTAGGRIDLAIELLEAILHEEKKVLPPDHIDLIATMLLLGRFHNENNQREISEVIFEHVFQLPLRHTVYPVLVRFAPDYCEVLEKLGKANAAKKIAYLFSKAADEAIAEQNSAHYVSSSVGVWIAPFSKYRDVDDWEKIGRTKQAQDRYIKSVEMIREHHSDHDLATEALNSLATYYVQNNRLGQAGEIYLQLAERLKTTGPDYSFRKVLCFMSLARCYTRLCMYEEVPEAILQAKQADPEIYKNMRTLDTTLNYVDVEVEAHLFESAREDLQTAESLIDTEVGQNHSKKRTYLERILQLWMSIGEQQSAALIKTKLDQVPLPEIVTEPSEKAKEETQAATEKEEGQSVSKEPLPFVFLECIAPTSVNSNRSVFESAACLYLKNLSDKISKNWFPPVEKQPTHLQIQFTVAKDGNWESIRMLRHSSNKYANIAAEEAIQISAPFESLPEEFGEQAVFQLTFNDAKYSLEKFGITFKSVE